MLIGLGMLHSEVTNHVYLASVSVEIEATLPSLSLPPFLPFSHPSLPSLSPFPLPILPPPSSLPSPPLFLLTPSPLPPGFNGD